MCKKYDDNNCDICEMSMICTRHCSPNDFSTQLIKKSIEFMQEWHNKNLPKTYAQDFLKKFPNAHVDNKGIPESCRAMIYGCGACKYSNFDRCADCWNEVIEDDEE